MKNKQFHLEPQVKSFINQSRDLWCFKNIDSVFCDYNMTWSSIVGFSSPENAAGLTDFEIPRLCC